MATKNGLGMRRRARGACAGWIAGLMMLFGAGPALADGTNTYKFTNNEGEHAHDLHIKFNKAVSWNIHDPAYSWQNPPGTFKGANGSGTTEVDLVEGAGGTGVDAGDSLDLTFGYGGDGFPEVKEWYWTKEDGSVLGKKKFPSRKQIKFEYASAMGGGLLDVWAHGQHLPFQTFPGEPAELAAQRLMMTINDALLYGRASLAAEADAVSFQGTAFGPPCDDFGVTVLRQDRAGPITVASIIFCRADLNGDGIVDFGDYLDFLNRYDQADPSVDFNGDGLVDFADYLEFLNLYEEGCPEPLPPCGM